MSIGHHHMTGEFSVDPAIAKSHIDKSIVCLKKDTKIVWTTRVPYLAGYCDLKDWHKDRIVFADYRLPKELKAGGKMFDPMRYVLIHECVEASLMAELGMPYELAHNFATAAERTAVETDGLNWRLYTLALKPWIAEARKITDVAVSDDLDRSPYRQEHELFLLKAA